MQWLPASALANGIYLASRAQEAVVAQLAEEAQAASSELRNWLNATEQDPDGACWQLLMSAMEGVDSAGVAEAICKGGQRNVATLTDILTELESSIAAQFPTLEDELNLRSGPLRQLWEARGPGMLKQLAAVLVAGGWNPSKSDAVGTAPAASSPLPPAESIRLMYPFCGGGGEVFSQSRYVAFECVLANPDAFVPETVRLGWLIGRLGIQTRFGELEPELISLALVPAAIAAAEEVEWSSLTASSVSAACRTWRLSCSGEELWSWWEKWGQSHFLTLPSLADLPT